MDAIKKLLVGFIMILFVFIIISLVIYPCIILVNNGGIGADIFACTFIGILVVGFVIVCYAFGDSFLNS
jgi:predicted ABC-type exoprotein transport system permease subunit